MRPISNTDGSFGYGEISGETGDFAEITQGKKFYKELIDKANSVPITHIFKHYGLRLNELNKKITCPFKSHKDGRESTASFYYYPNTNTYFCFGCKIGSRACDFVSEMDRCNKYAAANKILKLFKENVNENIVFNQDSFSEKLEIMMKFSNLVRKFRETYNDEMSFKYIEHICETYDKLNSKHNLNNEALLSIVNQLIEEINKYKI